MAAKKETALDRLFERAGIEQPTVSKDIVVATPPSAIELSHRTTRAQRKAQLLDDITQFNIERLVALRETLTSLPSLVTESLGEDAELTDEYAAVLMRQAIAFLRDVKDLQEAIAERIKVIAFDHFNASLAAKGHSDPEHMRAELIVEELGFALRREGAGYGDAKINEELLKELLGKDWKRVYTKTVIPRKEVFNLDIDALEELTKQRPELLEKIRPALSKGDPKPGRLNLRPL